MWKRIVKGNMHNEIFIFLTYMTVKETIPTTIDQLLWYHRDENVPK